MTHQAPTLAALIESAADAIITVDERQRITLFNAAARQLLACEADDVLGTPLDRFLPALQPTAATGVLHSVTARRGNGEALEVEVSISQAPGSLAQTFILRDLTARRTAELEMQRLNRLYRATSRLSQAIVSSRTTHTLFSRVCEALVEGGFRMAWVGWADEATHRLTPIASAGDAAGYLDDLVIYTDARPEGQGPTGTAFREMRPYICNDMLGDPVTLPWREKINRKGFRASAVFPITLRGHPRAALSVYSEVRDYFRDKEIDLLSQAASDLSFALDALEQSELRRSAEAKTKRFEAIIESTDDAIVSESPEGVITSWNPAAELLFGYPAAEVIGTPDTFLIPAEHVAEFKAVLERVCQGERVIAFETTRLARDGRRIPVSIACSPILAADGTVLGASKIIRDITAKKASEATAERERRFANSLIESMPAIFYLYNQERRFLRWNRNFEAVSEYRADEIAQMQPLDFFSKNDHQLLAARIDKVFEVGEATVEAAFVSKSGKATPYSFTGRRIIFEGEPSLIGVGIDISEREAAERALRDLNESLEHKVAERTAALELARARAESADKVKSSFLATMSHELRTPLNSIIGFTGIIVQGLAGPLNAEQAKQLGMVQGSARHLLELINDVLDISKIEAGQLTVHLESVDVRASVERAVAQVRVLAEKKGLTLTADLPATLQVLRSDRRRFEQILLNLLNNAIKFTSKGGVRLLVEDAPEALLVHVSDTGIGIKPTDLESLFQPFRQLDSGLERQHEGTGLGLAICRRLAELLGGTIRAHSTWGTGSIFTLTLPRTARGATA